MTLVASFPLSQSSRYDHLLKEYEATGKLPPVIVIEGTAFTIDEPNKNGWAVSEEAVPKLLESLRGCRLRIDHSESARDIIGKVVYAFQDGNQVKFKAEMSDADLIPKVLRGYLDSDSIQIDSQHVACSVCFEDVRSGKVKKEALEAEGLFWSREKDNSFKHLHKHAHEIVLDGTVRELSLVTTPAYSTAKFEPVEVQV